MYGSAIIKILGVITMTKGRLQMIKGIIEFTGHNLNEEVNGLKKVDRIYSRTEKGR